jgi:hypothetical protein
MAHRWEGRKDSPATLRRGACGRGTAATKLDVGTRSLQGYLGRGDAVATKALGRGDTAATKMRLGRCLRSYAFFAGVRKENHVTDAFGARKHHD